jgi:SAM-dependent methyltransferase
MPDVPYFRPDLARIHHEGFGFHADAVAPGVLAILEPVRVRGGTVLEIGCGSGLLTRYLVDAGHRVIATDASPAMVDLARSYAPGADAVQVLALPHDAVPPADAIVSVGHALSYLDSEADLHASLGALAAALRPGGTLAFDLCDLRWGEVRVGRPPQVWSENDWLLVTRTSVPTPDLFRRDMTMFVRNDGTDTWRRTEERHDNVLVDTTTIPPLLARHGVDAEVRPAFGDEELLDGLVAIVGTRRAGGPS